MASLAYSPSRQARMAKLNTIIEDESEYSRRQKQPSRSPLHQHNTSAGSPVPSLTSTISSYYHSVRYSSDPADWAWNELYDNSDDDESPVNGMHINSRPKLEVHIRPASGADSEANPRDSWVTDATDSAAPTRCPSMVIPSPRHWPTIEKLKQSQDGSLTPVALPISPLALSMVPAEHPVPSRTPSLDSLTSGDTASSAPTSPDVDASHKPSWNNTVGITSSSRASSVYDDEPNAARFSTGVQLPQDALSFLQHLSVEIPLEDPATPTAPKMVDIKIDTSVVDKEMVEVPVKLSSKPSLDVIPQSAASEYSISKLSIPSPGGFFAGVDSAWALSGQQSAGPDSTTAEQFYNTPWAAQETVREQVLEISADRSPGPATAMKLQPTPATAKPVIPQKDYDDSYQNDLKKAAEMSLDRTSSWLRAQCDYIDERLSGEVQVSIPKTEAKPAAVSSPTGSLHRRTSSAPMPKKKAVKFLDTVKANKEYLAKTGPLSSGSDPLFYQAFQHISNLSSPTDSFTARSARYEALQARRSSVSKGHVSSVMGSFVAPPEAKMPSPQRPISILPGSEPEMTFEQRIFAQAQRERDAADQIAPNMWVVEALRYLSGGRLLNSPAAAVLHAAPAVGHIGQSEVRVLDLGGQPTCDWAWHCAREFPHVKTYTASSDQRLFGNGAEANAANLRGPNNHRLVMCDNLWTLPFPDNHFDAVSARSLFAHLKANQRIAQLGQDQLDATLAECMRVLRPGGYLEFFVLDAEVVRGGPRGVATSVEFGYKLRQRGYEPNPTKAWLGRVRRAGFTDIKRAWMFLPMGALRENSGSADVAAAVVASQKDMPETPPPDAGIFEERIRGAQAVRGPVGSGAEVAEVSGLVGSWLWEQWILKLEMEMGKTGGDLGANVGGVVDEGRKTGSGWRSLSGWARKPE